MNTIHEANRANWNAWAQWWGERADKRGVWQRCAKEPGLILSPSELSFLSDVAGKDVCVLGSGDNQVVFALAGMGARVTSVDISEKQLEIAQARAATLGLKVTFLRADVTDLRDLADASFDVVYTGGHVSVWIADIRRYYSEAARILRSGGLFLINEYHPMRRMWHDTEGPAPHHPYFNRGPYEYRSKEGLPEYEYHWTVADHLQAVLDAGCALIRVEEYGEDKEDAEFAPAVPALLPTNLLIVAKK